MTQAEIKFDGIEIDVEIENHADNQLVCAACSVLGCTLLNCLVDEREKGRLENLSISVGSGSIFVKGRVKRPDDERISAIIDAIRIGYKSLEELYPENVKVVG